jgi:hypothetical protein
MEVGWWQGMEVAFQKQSQPLCTAIVKSTESEMLAPFVMFTERTMNPPGSTKTLSPEFGPQERLLLWFERPLAPQEFDPKCPVASSEFNPKCPVASSEFNPKCPVASQEFASSPPLSVVTTGALLKSKELALVAANNSRISTTTRACMHRPTPRPS